MTQPKVLATVSSKATESELTAILGPPDSWGYLADEDSVPWRSGKAYSTFSRVNRQSDSYQNPTSVAVIAMGTRVLRYRFTDGDSINPWGPDLFVYVSSEGKILSSSTALSGKGYHLSHSNTGEVPATCGAPIRPSFHLW
jgi:hypothetical protein